MVPLDLNAIMTYAITLLSLVVLLLALLRKKWDVEDACCLLLTIKNATSDVGDALAKEALSVADLVCEKYYPKCYNKGVYDIKKKRIKNVGQ